MWNENERKMQRKVDLMYSSVSSSTSLESEEESAVLFDVVKGEEEEQHEHEHHLKRKVKEDDVYCCSSNDVQHECTETTKVQISRPFSSSSVVAAVDKNEDELKLKKGIQYGCLSLGFLVMGMSMTMPFFQALRDELKCDAVCWGGMTSMRSSLQLIGSALVGRLSDGVIGRKYSLYVGIFATLFGLMIGCWYSDSLMGMWLGMIPGALLQQNFSVLKALFADYHDAQPEFSEQRQPSARASSAGQLGMAVGLSFMVGPLLGSTIVSTYHHSLCGASICTFVSGCLIYYLPDPKKSAEGHERIMTGKRETSKKKSNLLLPNKQTWLERTKNFLDVPAARSPACIFLIVLRICMAVAYHIFNTIWTVSLKERFNFGPNDHGQFMSFIGLSYAISQGLVSKTILKWVGHEKRAYVIMASCVILGFGRYIAFHTSSLLIVYITFGGIVTSLGIVNTVLTADTGRLAPSTELGGVYGVLEAVQNLAGMIGPLLGGGIASMGASLASSSSRADWLRGVDAVTAPLCAVVGLYVFAFIWVYVGYERYVVNGAMMTSEKMRVKVDTIEKGNKLS